MQPPARCPPSDHPQFLTSRRLRLANGLIPAVASPCSLSAVAWGVPRPDWTCVAGGRPRSTARPWPLPPEPPRRRQRSWSPAPGKARASGSGKSQPNTRCWVGGGEHERASGFAGARVGARGAKPPAAGWVGAGVPPATEAPNPRSATQPQVRDWRGRGGRAGGYAPGPRGERPRSGRLLRSGTQPLAGEVCRKELSSASAPLGQDWSRTAECRSGCEACSQTRRELKEKRREAPPRPARPPAW
jgi:hypothetical protein